KSGTGFRRQPSDQQGVGARRGGIRGFGPVEPWVRTCRSCRYPSGTKGPIGPLQKGSSNLSGNVCSAPVSLNHHTDLEQVKARETSPATSRRQPCPETFHASLDLKVGVQHGSGRF